MPTTLSVVFIIILSLICDCLTEEQRRLQILENAPSGTLVGRIRDDVSTPSPAYILVYPPESQVEQTFLISDRTGEIRTKIALDYETKNSFVFLAIPNGDRSTGSGDGIRVTIEVIDINDCPPEFPQKHIDLQLSEYAKIGTETPLPAAIDRDGSEKYGIQKYELISGNVNNAFKLGVRRLNRLLYSDLVINSELDRELLDHYVLEIRASDGGQPPLIDTLTVNITILDANDNTPAFDQPRYIARLPSNATVGTQVISVHAIDKDSGDNGVIDYRFLPSPFDAQKWFAIDGSSGRITLAHPFQTQAARQYELFVAARDRGYPQPLESTAFVTVSIVDTDQNRPDIKVIYLSEDGRPVISEAAQVGSLVARVSISDPDTKIDFGNRTNIDLEGDDDTFGVKQSSDAMYLLLRKSLDRETRANYTLTIVAKIGSVNYRRSLVIRIGDVNDNAPRFKQAFYESEIREKSTPGTSVVRVQAVDADEGENGAVTYSFASSSARYSNWLDIDPETGLITTADTIDCEISSRPEFTIVATDRGRPALSATTKLTVTVLDVNDNPPIFMQSLYNVNVREDADVGYCFLKVQANDPDCGVNAQIHYKLSTDTSENAYPFKVDQNSGNVCLASKLDYEQRKNYQFPVLAYDGGGLVGSTMVILAVEDINDNAPVFYPTAYNVTVRRDTGPGNLVLIVSAIDPDSGQFGTITYGIVAGNDEGKFRIDRKTGELFVDQRLSLTIYQLTIHAMDGGSLTSIQPAMVTVIVSTEDYPSPQFDQKFYRFTVREDTLPGIAIGAVRAMAPGGSTIAYAIYSGDPAENFTIDQQSGSIAIVRYLDYEVQRTVLLNIQATTDHPPAFNHTQVEVIIEDVNDNPPIFERRLVKTTVPEDHPLQKTVFLCFANDRDSGKNGEVRYRLVSNPGNAFMIHPISGEIRLTQSLDYEKQKNYTLIIVAQDGGIPTLQDNMTLEIDVLDVNDHQPKFALAQYTAIVSEDAAPMTRVIQLQATDEDSGVNGQITYKLESAPGEISPFRIFADNGWIYVRQLLDRESKREYTLTAVAKDNGQPSKSTRIQVIMKISDVNDHAPNCQSMQQLTIEENQKSGTFVGRVRADDPDEGENGTVIYQLNGHSPSHFRLTPTGELYTEVALDRENEPVYDLLITASDQARPPLSSVCTVRVIVLDENDQAPFFVLPLRDHLYFREEQPRGSEVAQIRASDPDDGENGTVRYRLEKSDVSVPFAIDPATGVLSSTQILDYEAGPRRYEVSVVAEDLGKPPRISRRTFIIDLVDIDDGGGSSNETIIFRVPELASVGYRIGFVDSRKSMADSDINSLTDADYVTHSYEIISGNSQGLFDIDRVTSMLYLIRQLDYEISSSHFLIVNKLAISKFTPTPNGIEIRVKVLVMDENDNTPTFYEDPVIFSVPENRAGFVIWQYNATDGDTGSFGRVEYKILEEYPNEPDLFELDSVSGELFLKKELDFERVAEYLLAVEASDQAQNLSQRRAGRVTTRIYVTDVNDNDPKFLSRDHVYVFVDEPPGYPLIYVAAVDEDWLENGRVTYRIASGNEDGQFHLNGTTGALLLTKPLKREESTREFHLNIVAEDHGIPQRSTNQILKLQVLDVEDYTLRFEQSVYRVNVTENGPAGVVVAQLRALSPDGSNVKDLLYILPNGTANNKFRMNEKTGSLLTTGSLDREEMDEYVLTVYVRDSPHSARYDAATVMVSVEDMNDNAPVIGEATCREQSVPENQPFEILHTVIASDRDTGLNGRLTFTIAGGNVDGKFRINSNTGEIACDALDRETISSYNLTIQVRDNGSPSQNAQCILPITVLDVNDNTPRFEQPSYSAQVLENTPPGTTVLKITATDADQGLNGKVMYSIANETAGLFDVGANTGEIVVLGKLDFEKENSYSFLVKAYDQGPSESKWDTVRVTVQILDVNDNAPVFPNVPFIANVSSNMAAGQRLVKVVATDADGPGPNSDVAYSLSNSDDRFVINPTTGVISAKQNLQLPSGTVEYLNVVATDHGEPPKSTTSVVEVVIDSSEEAYRRSAIKFSKPAYKVQIPEDALAGTRVVDIQASPPTTSSPVEYRIISGNESGTFAIDSSRGTISISDPSQLDYETTKSYQLIVEAKVKTKTAANTIDLQRAYVTVRIEVTDANDHAPQFLQQSYSAAVSEGKPKNTFVIQVSATDGDIGENAALTYSIVSGNVDSAFVVDNGGVVKTNAELDREIHDRYTLTVMAVDAGSPPKSGTAVIDVLVMDVNDNSPSFPAIRPIRISENTDVGSLLTTMTANDVDTFPPLVYSLANNSSINGHFNLDRFSGRLVLAKRLDYEQMHEMDLEIQVSDSVYVTSTRQKIIIQDENDNGPVFVQPFYQAALPFGARAGTSIVHVSATDLDSGANGKVHYTLMGAAPESAGFWINAQNGELFLNRSLVNSTALPPLVQLTVAAVDGGQPPRSAVTTVQIQMGYVSEQQIDFGSKSYSFSVSEDAPVHSIIGHVTSTASEGSAKQLRYLIKGGDTNQTFSIDSDGNLILMKRLDRETVDTYNLDMILQTKSNVVSNSSARITIQIADVNDNWPTFDQTEYQIPIRESFLPGYVITKLNAVDRDAGPNGSVTYELMSGDVENSIALDPQTGAVSLKKSILGIERKELRLIIRASDGGTPPKTTIAGLLLLIQKENTTAPIFPAERYIGWVTENAPVGTMVLRVKGATISGSTSVTNFTYAISSGNEGGYFHMDPINGELRTAAVLDYEQKTFYRLMVVVSDPAGRWANTSAQILVRGIDEYAPAFTQNGFTFQTSYDANEGEILGAVYATDRDAGVDGKINFALKDKTPYFRIHPQTGVISVAGSLANLQEPQKTKGQNEEPGPLKDVKSIFLAITAFSGPDHVSGKSNSTTVEIQIGRFTKSGHLHPASATTIVSISVSLILLLIFILVVVVVKLRRRDRVHKPSLSHKIAMAKQNARNRKNRQLIKTNDVIQPCPKAAQRAAAGFRMAENGHGTFRDGPPTGQVHLSGTTICNTSTKSSGRGSLTEETDAKSGSRLSNGCSSRQETRAGPDSGLHLYDDTASISSELHLPSTQEYLTSLGVEASRANGTVRKSRDECPRVDHGSVDAHDEVRKDDDDPVDVQDLIYSKINEVLANENEINPPKDSIDPSPIDDPMDNLYVSNGATNQPIMSPSTSWPVPLPNYGPSYQPLTQVFSEIAKIKSDQDTLRRRKEQRMSNGGHGHESDTQGSLPRIVPNSLRVNGSAGMYSQNGTMDRSPSTWAPTSFASPDDPNFGPYAISEPNQFPKRPEAELEIKI